MRPSLPSPPFLYAIVDVEASGEEGVLPTASRLIAAGVPLLQLRGKNVPDRRLFDLSCEIASVARAAGCLFLVNDRPDVAHAVGADGVHLGQDDLPPADARAVLGEGGLIGLSTHSLADLARSETEDVDYVAIGPIHSTRSKRNPDPVVGLGLLAEARRRTSRPLVAIGGIDRANAAAVVGAGADGVAVISDLLRGGDVAEAVAAFRAALSRRP